MSTLERFPGFVADAMALDFLNAFTTEAGANLAVDEAGDILLTWLQSAGLVPADALTAIREGAVPGELDALVSRTQALADWFRRFVYMNMGKSLPAVCADEWEPINRILQQDLKYGQVMAREKGDAVSGLTWQVNRRWHSMDCLLVPIAHAIADLVCNEDFSLIRECAGARCHFLFVDRTRSRGRRWCRMAACGNRAKQARRHAFS